MSDHQEAGHKFHQEARIAWTQQNLRWETEQAFLNHNLLYMARASGQVKCMSEAPTPGGPAIICGSGSTLDKAMPLLKKWKGAIFCSTTHGTTLVYHGAPPTYMAALDPRMAPDPELSVPKGGWDRSAYLAHVSTPRGYFEQWLGSTKAPAYVFRVLEPTVPWYTRHLAWAYPWVKVQMLPFIDSIASQVTLAARLGYDPLYMIGVDYGGPRMTQMIWVKGQWEKAGPSGVVDSTNIAPPTEKPEDLRGPGGLVTSDGMLYSKRGMLMSSFMRINDARRPVRVYQMSHPSNVVEFPPADLEQVLETQGASPPPFDREAVSERIETVLARSDTFLVPVNGGFGVDYRVYMLRPDVALQALSELNMEMLINKNDLLTKEKETGVSVQKLIEGGGLHVEAGELAIHERDDLKYFSAASMGGIEIEKVAARIKRLWDASREPATPPPSPAVPPS